MKPAKSELTDFFAAELHPPRPLSAQAAEIRRYVGLAIGRIHHLLRLPPPAPSATMLEIGSVPYFTSRALERFWQRRPDTLCLVNGAGLSGSGVEQQTKLMGDLPFPLVCLNAETTPLPFADGSFDLVLCQDVIEHLLFDPLFLVGEARRVLKTGGRFILSTSPGAFCWDISLRHLLDLNCEMGYDIAGRDPYQRHHRLFSLREVRQMLELNGFDIERAYACSHWYVPDPDTWLPSRLFKRFVYLLDRATAMGARLLPVLREKSGSQIWVLGRKREETMPLTYPRTLDMRSDFRDA
jgi:SAM-dependent methyltransferase